jgi:hypothetical protein
MKQRTLHFVIVPSIAGAASRITGDYQMRKRIDELEAANDRCINKITDLEQQLIAEKVKGKKTG